MLKYVSWKLPPALLLGITAVLAHAQVAPQAFEPNIPLVVGGGVSNYLLDWGYGRRMEGVTVWVDYRFTGRFRIPKGVGIEAEGTDLNWDHPSNLPKMRHDTAQLGGTYTWSHFKTWDPYAKMLGGIGSIDFAAPPGLPDYTHDTFSIFSPGGGVEYRIRHRIWVRGDYEYQFWRHTFGPHDLNPSGFTIGANYHLSRPAQ